MTLLINLIILLAGINLHPDLDQNGLITGTVSDRVTQEALIGVNILIHHTTKGGTTDLNGEFSINNLEPGVYSVEFRYLGYQSLVRTDVVVRNHRPTVLNIELQPTAIEGQEIVVRTNYFNRDGRAPVSRTGFNAEEIRRSPGSGQELSRVIMVTPGIATNGDTSQDLLVRGGSPSENGFYIDNIPVPGVSHFERQNGGSNGPIGIVNTDLVEYLDFYAGGFSPAFGNHASSVADIRYREGSRTQFHGSLDMSMAGFGLTIENPIFNGKGSILLSGRRSYLDLLANAINAGGAPRYGDIQMKATYDINNANRLTFLQLFGDSLFESGREEAKEMGVDAYAISRNNQNTTGLNWRRLWSANVYSNTSLSYSSKIDDTESFLVDDNSTEMHFDISRKFMVFRNTNFYRLNEQNRFEFGLQAEYQQGQFNYQFGSRTNTAGVVRPEVNRNMDIDQFLAGTFLSWIGNPLPQLTLSAGSRVDYNNLNSDVYFSPRGGLIYELTDRFALKASAGIYHQTLPLYFRSQQSEFTELSDFNVVQLIGGFDYQLSNDTQLTVEFYDKQYHNLPSQPQNHSMGLNIFVMDTEMFFDELTDNGRATARGADLLIQKKLAKDFYGMLSGSVFRSEFRNAQDEWVSRNFDVNYIFNVIGGYRPGNVWDVSVRWSYIGPRPYTPIDAIASEQAGAMIMDYSRYNQEHMPAYHSLFLRFDRRRFYNKMTLTTFMEMWNTYNRKNVEGYFWSVENNEIVEWNQFSLLPVGGFRIEF